MHSNEIIEKFVRKNSDVRVKRKWLRSMHKRIFFCWITHFLKSGNLIGGNDKAKGGV